MTAKVLAALFFAAGLIYAGSNAIYWWRHWWSLPYWDHVYWLMLYRDHGLWHVMSRNLNEHRLFFPSLLYWAELEWFGNRLRVTELCLAAAHVGGFGLLLRPFWRDRAVPLAAALTATGGWFAFTFWLGQCENLFWSFQFHTIFCNFALVAACAFFARAMSGRGGMAPAAACGVLATFSFGHGMLVWPALALTAALRRQWRVAALFAGSCGAMLAIYLRGYESPPHHANPLASLARPLDVFYYFSIYTARPFLPPAIFDQIHHRTPTFLMGTGRTLVMAIGAAAVIAMLWFMARYARKVAPWPEEHLLLPVAIATLASGAVTALGRLEFAPEALLTGRYATLEAMFWFSMAALTGFALIRAAAGPAGFALWAIALAGFGYLSLESNREIGGFCRERSAAIEQERLTLRLGVFNADRWSKLVPNAGLFQEFLLPWYASRRMPPFEDTSIAPIGQAIPREQVLDQDCQGHVDIATRIETKTGAAYSFLGWVWNQFESRDVRDVLIAKKDSGEIVGAGSPGMIRDDLPRVFNEPNRWAAGFVATTKPIGPGHALVFYGKLDDKRYCRIAETVAQ